MSTESLVKRSTFSLDEFLRSLGKYGRYQLLVFLSICLLVFLAGSYAINFIFTAGNVNYRCRIPECDVGSENYKPHWLRNAVPFDENEPNSCFRFKAIKNVSSTGLCNSDSFDSETEESCDDGVIFEDLEKTIASEFNLTCDEKWKLRFVATLHNMAYFVNLAVSGYFSDRYGRKTVFMFSILMAATMGIIKSFAWSYVSFLALEVLGTFLSSGFFTAAYILAVEILSPEIRSNAGPVFMSSATIGAALLALFTWMYPDWKITLRVTSALGFISVIYFWLIPESFHWLLARRKHKKVAKALLKVAKINKIDLPDDMKDVLENRPEDIRLELQERQNPKSSPTESFVDIFKYPTFCIRTIACAFCWITNVFVYSGLAYTSVAIGGNKFISFIAVSLIDIPGLLFSFYYVDKIGRQRLLVISYFVSGTALMASVLIPDIYWLRLILYLIGKFAIEAAFSTTYIFTSEIFPTSLRHRLFGLCSCFGRIGSIVSSQAPLLQDFYKPLPALLFATCAIISGCLSLTFPETLNTTLPDTIVDALRIGKFGKRSETET